MALMLWLPFECYYYSGDGKGMAYCKMDQQLTYLVHSMYHMQMNITVVQEIWLQNV